MSSRTSERPIRRAPEQRREPATGRSRLEVVLTRYRHQLRPGAFHVLLLVEWADLYRTCDVKLLDAMVRARLARPESRGYLIQPFDPRDAVGELPVERPIEGMWSAPR